ncbi:glycosyltransferase family 2 protein [Salinibacterium sp. NK8237]|uniref:glycosyltransferase family 2 protein n=1 Tax=Salinibacterium sp. NK8237 TaxID=2792038 RepID=UPI0018CDA5C3|nr:glycosyltransferase family 2 protein [Salinibacterium sp. NK8237]MBH0131096.1 glycosyltransferase [Salinibacterium sp. NK8237]
MPKNPTVAPSRRRQWGAESRLEPLPTVHPAPSDRKIALARLAIVATIVFWLTYVIYTIARQFINNGTESFRFTTEAISYVIVVTFLTFSALMYLIARHGAFQRFRAHARVPRAELDRHFADNQGSITVLVPSYSEEPDVVRATLWSACLQEYPSLSVVLLLDDPPFPDDPDAAAQLSKSRQLTEEIQRELAAPRARFADALSVFESRLRQQRPMGITELADLAGQYQWASAWLENKADNEQRIDHVDEFFVAQVLQGLAGELQLTADALGAALDENMVPPATRLHELYRRLARTFDAELSTFERKLYASVSHEANKAMNLNAYIGLMGGNYRPEETPDGTVLRPVSHAGAGDLSIPDSEYLLTLDADSLLLRDYCLRLVYLLEQKDNARVAVTQTPYSSFRGASTRIERLAGATTDLQHILHQGKSYYGATFWVGANAVIRKAALDDIVETETEGGFTVKRYVQDRTVIEDTESSIDLGTHGWTLVNYPERLSYSATPPDFGSLVVQRRRWANGGLLIMPKLMRQMRERRARGETVPWTEFFLRVNYMTSITWASFGLVFLLAYPYDSRLLSPVVLLAAVPYFLAMGSDLRYSGYKFSDIFRIYGFNLILLPVNLAGVLKSLEQAITSKKIPFARTPKVRNRTATPLLYVIAPLIIIGFSAFTFWRDLNAGNWGNAAFAAFNTILAGLALVSYIGIWNAIVDIWIGVTSPLFVERKPRKQKAEPEPDSTTLDWRSILYYGDDSGSHRKVRDSIVFAEMLPPIDETREVRS